MSDVVMMTVDGREREYRIVVANGVPVFVGYGANLVNADLSGADLAGLDLSFANLRGAELTFADLSGSNLSFVDLSDANVIGANLRGANLRGAVTLDASLTGADLRGATYDERSVRGAFLSDELTPEHLKMLGASSPDETNDPVGSLSPVDGSDEGNREGTTIVGEELTAVDHEQETDDPPQRIVSGDAGERVEETSSRLSRTELLADASTTSDVTLSSPSDAPRSGRRRDYSGLLERLSAGIAELTTSEKWTQYLEVQSRFYRYSPNNVMLIQMQNPYATRVAGYKAWQALGRQVLAKESALRILAPMTYKKDDGPEGEKTSEIRGFKLVPVFDISQTDGPDLPDVVSKLEGLAPEGVFDRLTEFAESIGFRVERPELLESGANGDTTHSEGRIRVVSSNSEAQQAKTLAHEIGHALLHDPGSRTTKDLDRGLKELEAESAAYVICTALDMDTSDYSFGYVAGWAGGGPEAIQGIKESAARIQKAATAVLKTFEIDEPSAEVAYGDVSVNVVPLDPRVDEPLVREHNREMVPSQRDGHPWVGDALEADAIEASDTGRVERGGVTSGVEPTDVDGAHRYQPLSAADLEVLDPAPHLNFDFGIGGRS